MEKPNYSALHVTIGALIVVAIMLLPAYGAANRYVKADTTGQAAAEAIAQNPAAVTSTQHATVATVGDVTIATVAVGGHCWIAEYDTYAHRLRYAKDMQSDSDGYHTGCDANRFVASMADTSYTFSIAGIAGESWKEASALGDSRSQ